jgi:hypothetical protein
VQSYLFLCPVLFLTQKKRDALSPENLQLKLRVVVSVALCFPVPKLQAGVLAGTDWETRSLQANVR